MEIRGEQPVSLHQRRRYDRRTSPPVDPLEEGLELRLRFDEEAGEVAADSSGNGRSAAIHGASHAHDPEGKCLEFNGRSDFVEIPDMGTFKSVTLAGWICPRVERAWQAILHCDGWDSNATHLSLQSDGALFFSLNGNDPVDARSAPFYDASTVGTWRHFAVVYDAPGKSVKFFRDGILSSSVNYTTAKFARWVGGIKVGSWGGSDRFFDGKMRDLRFYSRALADSEIRRLASR